MKDSILYFDILVLGLAEYVMFGYKQKNGENSRKQINGDISPYVLYIGDRNTNIGMIKQ